MTCLSQVPLPIETVWRSSCQHKVFEGGTHGTQQKLDLQAEACTAWTCTVPGPRTVAAADRPCSFQHIGPGCASQQSAVRFSSREDLGWKPQGREGVRQLTQCCAGEVWPRRCWPDQGVLGACLGRLGAVDLTQAMEPGSPLLCHRETIVPLALVRPVMKDWVTRTPPG